MPDTIAYRTGTYRTVSPEETWARVRPMLPRFGITRVADITRLDEIGLPVHLAYRPTSLTYAVSIGTGATSVQSRVSAVMESIEAWHGENVELPVVARAPAAALHLGYDVRALNLAPRSPVTPDVVLDWVAGRGLLTGRDILVPVDCIRLDMRARLGWQRVLFRPTSNGLATGNTVAEAVLHGLHELIERESVSAYLDSPAAARRYVDPRGCRNPLTERVYDALRGVGCTIVACDITGPVGLPGYVATIWSPDVPLRCGGFGAHVDAGIALGRALAEAAQSRLAAISGARDDIGDEMYGEMTPLTEPADAASFPASRGWPGPDDLESVIRHCASLVAAVTGAEPCAVRLDHDEIGIPAVKVIAPGLRVMDSHRLVKADPNSAPSGQAGSRAPGRPPR
jgi:YcaO-like protein with predicted kinase domain